MRMRQTIRAVRLERHTHTDRYAAVVLSGGYEEAGDLGRFQVCAGDVVLHDQFEAHLNRFSRNGAIVLNLRLGRANKCCPGIATVADADLVARVAETDRRAATELLLSIAETCAPALSDWPDELATKLISCPSLALSRWAEEKRLAPWTISRGFSQVFGISPEAFRDRDMLFERFRTPHALWPPLRLSLALPIKLI